MDLLLYGPITVRTYYSMDLLQYGPITVWTYDCKVRRPLNVPMLFSRENSVDNCGIYDCVWMILCCVLKITDYTSVMIF